MSTPETPPVFTICRPGTMGTPGTQTVQTSANLELSSLAHWYAAALFEWGWLNNVLRRTDEAEEDYFQRLQRTYARKSQE